MTSDGPGLDLAALMAQMGQVQQNLQAAQEAIVAQVVRGSAGGGKVTVELTGALDVQSVSIDPAVVDSDDVDLLEDLVLAALRDAVEQARDLQAQSMGGLGTGGGLPGLLGQ